MPSDTYILTISEAGVSVPSTHASTHLTGGSDAIPVASTSTSGLMSPTIFDQHVVNTAKVSNATHTGDVTDASGVLTVDKIKGVSLAGLGGGVLKVAATTGIPSIAIAADYPTLNQSTTGNAATATKATNIAGGSAGSIPYQSAPDTTSFLGAGTSGYVLISNGSNPPSWGSISLSTQTTGTVPVSNGGTGQTTFTAGLLKANGTNSFTTVAAPTGTVVGTSDTQTLTNKTLTSPTLSTPVLGTPSSGILTNCTALPLTTGITGVLPAANGGTGQSSYAVGDLLYADTTTSVAKLQDITAGNVLLSGGLNSAPSYGKVGLTTHVTGTLPVANGGTGAATLTGYVKGTGTTAMTAVPTIPATDGGTGQSSYAVGDLLYAGTTTSIAKLADVAAGSVLLSGGLNLAPSYGKVGLTTHVTGTLPVANGGTGVTSSTGTGDTVRATSPTLITPVLGTPASGSILTNCTGLPLTTGVTGTLPVANGGTGATQSAYGDCYISSATSTPIPTIGAFVKVAGTTTAGVLSNFTHPTSNRLTYTGTATRKFLVTAALSFHGTASNDYKFTFYKNALSLLTSSIMSSTGSGAGNLSHVSCQCVIELANNEFIEVFVTNANATNNATIDFMNITAVALI